MTRSLAVSMLSFALATTSSFAHAQGQIKEKFVSPSQDRQDRGLNLDVGLVSYTYEEPGLMKISGLMVQTTAGYKYHFGDKKSVDWWLGVDGLLLYSGANKYDGAIQDLATRQTKPISSGSNDFIYDVRGLGGLQVYASRTDAFDVYTGFGRWDIANKLGGPGGYFRETTYLYLPIGLTYDHKFDREFTWVNTFEYDWFLDGKAYTQFSDANPGSNNPTFNQKNGYGLRLKSGVEWRTAGITWVGALTYQAWGVDQSDSQNIRILNENRAYVEPTNTTSIYGLSIGARF